jgi:superfamily II DNA or RNA helicase
MDALKTIKYGYIIGLSATIPRNIKAFFRFNYHSEVVSCDIIEAIDSEVLPEPTILLFPLQVENTRMSETIEVNPKVKGPVVHGEYKDYWKYKKSKVHAILKCTQKQKLMELDKSIEWYKKKAMSGNMAMKQSWLYLCGKRLEFLADCKLQWVKLILHHLDKERTITFCKTIAQTEQLGKNCIHSQNKDAAKVYDDFNQKKIDHITAVNILNENANLVDCKYAVFCNMSSSDVVSVQRIGRSLRHKSPVIILPYYKDTREQELVETRRRVVDDLYATEAEIDELLQDEAVKTYLKLKEDYRVNRFNVLSEKKRILDGELQTLDSFILPKKDPRSK